MVLCVVILFVMAWWSSGINLPLNILTVNWFFLQNHFLQIYTDAPKWKCSQMLTPLHEHELQQVNPLDVYGAYAGHWKCDNCNTESSANQYPFHCAPCSFDLCYSCAQMSVLHNTLAHQHSLYYVETSRLFYQNEGGLWRCRVCKKTSTDLRETYCYHCPTCSDFDICRSCFEPKQHPIHVHILELADTSLLYPESRGNWVCDICNCQSRPQER